MNPSPIEAQGSRGHDVRLHSSSAASRSDKGDKLPLVRTCNNCSKAKVRCEMLRGSQSCDRCVRLKRDCHFRESRRRQNVQKKDDRIEILEAKLEKMMSLTQGAGKATTAMAPNMNFNDGTPDSVSRRPDERPPPPVFGTPVLSPTRDVIDAGIVSIGTAEHLVNLYITSMTPHFPFVVLPPDTTASSLRQEKPFLLLAILAVASHHDHALQQVLGREVRQYVCHQMVVLSRMDFSLLQGLLVYVAWFQYSSKKGHNNQFWQFLQIATSIIGDLRLEKPPESIRWRVTISGRTAASGPSIRSENIDQSSFEVMRAVAGCYYLSSSSAMALDKMGTMSCSKYITECCEIVSEKGEYDTDRYLTHIVKLQQLLEDITLHYKPEDSEKNLASANFALQSKIIAVKSELETFREGLPFLITDSPLIALQFHTIELYICQMSLLTSNLSPRLMAASQLPNQDLLHAGLGTATSFLSYYLSMPQRDEFYWNHPEWLQVAYILTATAKLCVAAQTWRVHSSNSLCLNTIRLIEALDMSLILKQDLNRKLALVSDSVDTEGNRDVFFYYGSFIAKILEWYENNAYPLTEQNVEEPTNCIPLNPSTRVRNVGNEEVVDDEPAGNAGQSYYGGESLQSHPGMMLSQDGLISGLDMEPEGDDGVEPRLIDLLADIDIDMGMAADWSTYPWR